jgi:hypothetical protein
MEAIELAKKHFSTKQVREIKVPAWVDEQGRPLSVWVFPMTVKDRDHLIDLEKRLGVGLELCVHVLILHARDEQGKPHFTLEHKHDLMHHADPDILVWIASQMFDGPSPADIKKK